MNDQSLLQHIFGPDENLSGSASQTEDAEISEASLLQFESAVQAPVTPLAAAAIREVGDNDDDTIRGTSDDDVLLGLGGNDVLIGRAGDDTLNGSAGNDRLVGSGGADLLVGGSGNDSLFGGGGADVIKGNGGNDSIKGGGGSDRLLGGGGSDTIRGNGGSDFINGGGGNDTIIAGPGSDTIKGGGGNDVFLFTNGDINRSPLTTITAFQTARDTVDLSAIKGLGPFSNLDLVDTGAGAELTVNNNTILFLRRKVADLSAFNFNLDNNDPFLGSNGDDTLSSGPGSDLIQGAGGNDKLGAGVGLDTLIGGDGADIFVVRVENGVIDPTVDVVTDFLYADGDKVGLTEALNGVSFDDLADVASARIVGADTIIAVKRATADNPNAAFQDVLRLEGVSFETADLISYGFTAPPVNSTEFVDNPYGFANNSLATADPAATQDGVYVAWVDQQNLDNDPFDIRPEDNENSATRDVFIKNTTTGAIQRVTERTEDNQFTEAASPALSADGRMVAYVMEQSGNSGGNVFVRDMAFPESAPIQINITEDGEIGAPGTFLINQNRGGLAGSRSNESISVVDISADGRKVVFTTRSKLSDADQNSNNDVYLRDLDAGTTTLISTGTAALAAGSTFAQVKISDDGRYIAFASSVALTPGEEPAGTSNSDSSDLYLTDTATGKVILISTGALGTLGEFDLSGDGSRLVFATDEAVTADDTNGLRDIYVTDVDLASFEVTSRQRVSEADGRFQVTDDDSYAPTISHDGERIAFLSQARDLVNFGPTFNASSNNLNEQLYLLDLKSGALTTPAETQAVSQREGLITHVALTDDSFVYRKVVEAADGGNRNVSDSIAFGTAVEPVAFEVADDGSNARITRSSSFRSEIDSPGDVDTFFLSGLNDRRDLSISVEGTGAQGGTLTDAKVTVLRDGLTPYSDVVAEDLISDNDGLGNDDFVRFDSGSFQNLFFKVEGVNGATGSYRVVIDDLDEPPTGGPLPAPSDFIF